MVVNTSDLVYRRVTEKDLPFVAELEAVSFATPWSAGQYKAVMQQGGCALFGAWRGTLLAGYIAIAVNASIQEMEVYNIAVAEAYRRKGIARRLLSLALEAAARRGAEMAILEVRIANAPAIALYQTLGFCEVGVRKGYYHDTGEDALVLARSLK